MPTPHLNLVDPVRDGYDYKPYTNPIGKEDIPEDKLDLDRLNLSIDDFQEVSKGKYNAGNLVLNAKGKLDIANNHRHFTSLNGKSTLAADSFAIRVAFAEALENAGVSDERMTEIRESLGLDVDSSIKNSKAFKPLTRQAVREIIDANIDAINEGRDLGTELRTQAQLQTGLSNATKAERENIRKTINRALDEDPLIGFQSDLNIIVHLFFPQGFSDIKIGDLQDMQEFAEDCQIALDNLADTDLKSDWTYHNTGFQRFERISNEIALELGRDGNVNVLLNTPTKTLTIPLGQKPGTAKENIERTSNFIAAAIRKAGVSPRQAAEKAVAQAAAFIKAEQAKKAKAEQGQEAEDAGQAGAPGFPERDATEEETNKAVELVVKHGGGLTQKGRRLLAAHALNAVCSGVDEVRTDADNIVANVAKDIRTWRSFMAGDERFAAVDNQLCDYAQGLLDYYLAPEKAGKFNEDGLFESFVTDANRAIYKFGDETFHLRPADAKKPVLDAFLKTVKKPKHRKALSTLMSQMTDSMTEYLSKRVALEPTGRHPDGLDLSKAPGIELFVRGSGNVDDGFHANETPALMGQAATYALEMSADGQTATMTVTQKGSLLFNVAKADEDGSSNNPVGSITRTMVFTLDLSTDDVKITSLHLSQNFDTKPPAVENNA